MTSDDGDDDQEVVGGSDGTLGVGVPFELAEPLGKGFPGVVGNRVRITVVLKVDIGVSVVSGVDI